MLVGRFSPHGFIPQRQTHMIQAVDYVKNFDEKTCGYDGHILDMIKLGVQSQLKSLNHEFSFVGIHVFFLPVIDEDRRFFLNHLQETPEYHEKEIDDNTICHRLDAPYSAPPSTLIELYRLQMVGAYIPF